jgi:hypothetical protein
MLGYSSQQLFPDAVMVFPANLYRLFAKAEPSPVPDASGNALVSLPSVQDPHWSADGFQDQMVAYSMLPQEATTELPRVQEYLVLPDDPDPLYTPEVLPTSSFTSEVIEVLDEDENQDNYAACAERDGWLLLGATEAGSASPFAPELIDLDDIEDVWRGNGGGTAAEVFRHSPSTAGTPLQATTDSDTAEEDQGLESLPQMGHPASGCGRSVIPRGGSVGAGGRGVRACCVRLQNVAHHPLWGRRVRQAWRQLILKGQLLKIVICAA